MPEHIAVCPVQPPGREKRRSEPPLLSVEDVAGQFAQEVISEVRTPYAIFGHSTGALCTFELAKELRRLMVPLPVHLFVSGRRAPQIPMERTDLGGMSVEELEDALRGLGGTPQEILQDHELLELIRPLLAADFSVNESYHYRPEPPLDIPITVFAATDDDGADVEQLAAWETQTKNGFRMHVLSGGHFAVFEHAAEVHSLISAALEQATAK